METQVSEVTIITRLLDGAYYFICMCGRIHRGHLEEYCPKCGRSFQNAEQSDEQTYLESRKVTPEELRSIRESQPARIEEEAYAQMERARGIS